MKLYPIPGGTWAGTEAEWKAGMKAAGHDPKTAVRKTIEVPTDKKGLMEFLTFYGVDVISPRTVGAAVPVAQVPTTPEVDVEALRALHNPDGVRPSALAATTVPEAPGAELDRLFDEAPIGAQLRLAVQAIDNAGKQILGR